MVGVRLTDFEQGAPFAGDYAAALGRLQERLAAVQLAQTVHGSRAIVLFDGWEGSGRKAVLKLLAAALDPTRLAVHSAPPSDTDRGRHWLARHWSRVPAAGETAIVFGSWYADAVRARLGGLGDKEWARTSDEINEFEAQQTDHGTMLVKLFFQVTPQVQAMRLGARAADPWLRWTIAADTAGAASTRAAAQPLWEQLLSRSNTRWAPWTIVDSGDEESAAIAALSAIADLFEKKVPKEPPASDENIVPLTRMQHG